MIGDLIIDEYSFEEDREFPPQQHNEPMSEEQLNYYEQLFMNIYNEEKTEGEVVADDEVTVQIETSIDVDEEQSFQKTTNDSIARKRQKSNTEIENLNKKVTIPQIINVIEECTRTNPEHYPQNDIGASRIFYKTFQGRIIYVYESKNWYIYNGKLWEKDEGGLIIMELIKRFAIAYSIYALNIDSEELIKYTAKLTSRSKRDSIYKDACSVAPKKLSEFDSNPYLFNCQNGTLNLQTGELQQHSSSDYITKISNVTYDKTANCDRWVKFVSEIIQGDQENEKFLQKSFGYALSGEINLECFFIFYGSTTRNRKSTACETISNILGDYSTNAQAKSLAKNRRDGSRATPESVCR